MATTVNVVLVNSQSDDPVTNLTMPETMTIGEFLTATKVNTTNMAVTIRVNGEVIDYNLNDELEDGMRISVVPQSVKGA